MGIQIVENRISGASAGCFAPLWRGDKSNTGAANSVFHDLDAHLYFVPAATCAADSRAFSNRIRLLFYGSRAASWPQQSGGHFVRSLLFGGHVGIAAGVHWLCVGSGCVFWLEIMQAYEESAGKAAARRHRPVLDRRVWID